MKKLQLTGQTFGRLVVLGPVDQKPAGAAPATSYWYQTFWSVRCVCGTVKTIGGQSLRSGQVKSCGCLVVENLHKARAARAARRATWK